MQQEQSSENGSNHEKREDPQAKVRLVWSTTGTAIAIWIFLIVLFFLWVFLPDYVPDRTDRAKVFLESMFSLAIVIVVVVHAVMYFKQADIAARQIDLIIENERAYIGVRNIKPIGLDGKEDLAVRITFRNGGRSPAFGFRSYVIIAVKEVGEDPGEFKWIEVASPIARSFVPAKEDRNVFVPYLLGISHDAIIIGEDKRLFVDGEARYFTLGGQEVVLCFGVIWNGKEFEIRHHYERHEKANPNEDSPDAR